MPTPRVLLLVNSLMTGGAERNVAAYVGRLDRSRFDPEVWTLLPGGDYLDEVRQAGVSVTSFDRRGAFDVWCYWQVARRIARSGADLVHAFSPQIGFCGALAKACLGLQAPMVYYQSTSTPQGGRFAPFRSWTIARYDHYMANSPSTRAALVKCGVDASRVEVIPNGHEIARFARNDAARRKVRAELGVANDSPVALSVGRLTASKRFADLVEAFRLVRREHPQLHLAIAGDGPERGALEAQLAEHRLGESVSLLGRRGDVPELLQAADIFVFASEIEGLANSVIEAALAERPIVACDIPGVREIVRDGHSGWLAPVRDVRALAAIWIGTLKQPAEMELRARQARQDAEKAYGIENSVAQLSAFYDRILSHRSDCAS